MDDGRAARGQKIIYFPAQSKGTIMTEMPKCNILNIIHTMLSFNGTFFAHFFPSLLRSLSGSVRGTAKPPLPIPRHTRVLCILHVHAISNRIKPRHFNSSNVLTPRRRKTRRESRGGKGRNGGHALVAARVPKPSYRSSSSATSTNYHLDGQE